MNFNNRTLGMAAASLAGAAGIAASASGVTISASDPFITIMATNGSGTGTFTVALNDVAIFNDPDQDVFYWGTTGEVTIFNGLIPIATLVNMTVLSGRNTQPDGEQRYGIDIDFGVRAGLSNTTFTLISPTMSFGPLQNARGLVSAGLVGTDQNTNGITVGPTGLNGFGFNAMFNGPLVFRSYFDQSMVNVASGSVGAAGNMVPGGMFQPMGTVANMTTQFDFMVTAGDTAGGTTTYSVAPAPTTLAIVGLSGLLLGRRRR